MNDVTCSGVVGFRLTLCPCCLLINRGKLARSSMNHERLLAIALKLIDLRRRTGVIDAIKGMVYNRKLCRRQEYQPLIFHNNKRGAWAKK
jgi:hypothetical protein